MRVGYQRMTLLSSADQGWCLFTLCDPAGVMVFLLLRYLVFFWMRCGGFAAPRWVVVRCVEGDSIH